VQVTMCFYGTVIRPVLEYACPALKSRCHADEDTLRIIYKN